MNWTQFVFFGLVLLVFFFFSPPHRPFYFSHQNQQSQPLFLCDTYFMNTLNFHLQNQQLMCMLFCIESYVCICFCMFSHYTEFWYCISSTSVNFTGVGPYLADRIRWTVRPASGLTWLVSAGAAVVAGLVCLGLQSWDETSKNKNNIEGHTLDGRSCKSFLDLLAACEAGM